MNANKLRELEHAARNEAEPQMPYRGAGPSRTARVGGHTVTVTMVGRYNNAAQDIMLNAQWKMDGKVIGYSKLAEVVS
jgi:hypothetical protein